MNDLSEHFEERLGEISSYLQLLEEIEALARSGVPRLGGPEGAAITTDQQRILYSSAYLQLYNLVEATITRCLNAVSNAAMLNGSWAPGDLTAELRREWVKHIAKTNLDMGADKRLEEAIALCEHLVAALPVNEFNIEKGGGGNWDDSAIYKIAKRIGCPLRISKKASAGVKAVLRNDKGAMALIVSLRNGLAHGNLSFVECGQDDTVAELRDLTERVATYMREVVAAFSSYVQEYGYLRPESRPAATG
jgi:hypothetical protein